MSDKQMKTGPVVEESLRERIKELNCLFGIADIIERSGNSVEQILQHAVNLLPSSCQYSEITCARIIYKTRQFETSLFHESDWSLKFDFIEGGEVVGRIEVYYLKEMPLQYEGPFLQEERKLLDSIARSISKALERISRIEILEEKLGSVLKQNAALRSERARVQKTQSVLVDGLQANIDILIMPMIQRLQAAGDESKELGLLLERSIKKLLSPFLFMMSSKYLLRYQQL